MEHLQWLQWFIPVLSGGLAAIGGALGYRYELKAVRKQAEENHQGLLSHRVEESFGDGRIFERVTQLETRADKMDTAIKLHDNRLIEHDLRAEQMDQKYDKRTRDMAKKIDDLITAVEVGAGKKEILAAIDNLAKEVIKKKNED